MEKQKQTMLLDSVDALKGAAIAISTAVERDEITGDQIYQLLILIARQQKTLITSTAS